MKRKTQVRKHTRRTKKKKVKVRSHKRKIKGKKRKGKLTKRRNFAELFDSGLVTKEEADVGQAQLDFMRDEEERKRAYLTPDQENFINDEYGDVDYLNGNEIDDALEEYAFALEDSGKKTWKDAKNAKEDENREEAMEYEIEKRLQEALEEEEMQDQFFEDEYGLERNTSEDRKHLRDFLKKEITGEVQSELAANNNKIPSSWNWTSW